MTATAACDATVTATPRRPTRSGGPHRDGDDADANAAFLRRWVARRAAIHGELLRTIDAAPRPAA